MKLMGFQEIVMKTVVFKSLTLFSFKPANPQNPIPEPGHMGRQVIVDMSLFPTLPPQC